MNVPPIYFIAGMPRSGSTLFANCLAQNPEHHVTPTNGLSVFLTIIRERWQQNPAFRAQGLWENIMPRVKASCRGVIKGFYDEEFEAGKIVFDKDRGWLGQVRLIEDILEREVRVITTIRDPRDVIASFEKLRNKSPMSAPPSADDASWMQNQSQFGRAAQLLAPDGIVGSWIKSFREVRDTDIQERMIVVPYNRFLTDPTNILNDIHERLELPAFEYDPDKIEQITHENDEAHGWKDLHVIRGKIEPPPAEPGWSDVLTQEVADEIMKGYTDIAEIAAL